MFIVKKRLEIAGAHNLRLPYESKCKNVHGHNWIVVVECRAEELNESGMVADFTEIKRQLMKFDHTYINDLLPAGMNPTAENLAHLFANIIGETCYSVIVQESEGNTAEWRRE